jgi:hypothetical protein
VELTTTKLEELLVAAARAQANYIAAKAEAEVVSNRLETTLAASRVAFLDLNSHVQSMVNAVTIS